MAGQPGADAGTRTTTTVQFGDHLDTIETVDIVFKAQRKLSFTFGAIFFGVTLGIPALSVLSEWWYGTPIWGGFTPNYLFVAIIYFFFLWGMAWTYSKQADKLDERLNKMAEEIEAKVKAQGV
jgi:uncharacterized membrane protein (DUF485 family)